jgi:hypothetical protein
LLSLKRFSSDEVSSNADSWSTENLFSVFPVYYVDCWFPIGTLIGDRSLSRTATG